jgi:uncharacterized protein
MKTLSLNGGGAKGYMSAYILMRLEEAFDNKYKAHELFDMIGGVSTGSIIGAMLAKGYSAKETTAMYRDFIPKIFAHKRWAITSLFRAKYSRDALQDIVRQHINFPINQAKTKYMAYAVMLNGSVVKPKFWKSWKDTISSVDVVLASSAAPTYFNPYQIGNDCFVDGGMACNNPSMCVISEAIRAGATLENMYNVNIACDTLAGYPHATKNRGLLKWAPKAIDVAMYAASGIEEYQAHTLLGFNNHYISPNVSLPLDCQDFKLMESIAEEQWQLHKQSLIENLSPDK